MLQVNESDLWRHLLPLKTQQSHKYTHGHAVIYAAPELTGATRLAAEACARMGAGLVTVLTPRDIANVYRTVLPAHVLVRDDLNWFDERVTAKLYGPGGLSAASDFKSKKPVVLDAGALASLPERLTLNYVLTPHEGEFEQAFPNITGSREERAKQAAQALNAHIVLKGAETIVAAPDGRCLINKNAPPCLATAGTGDVLAGMITGLVAQNMPIFEACGAAVWIHGRCANEFGMGLVASDLIGLIPGVLGELS
jgi:hydroxyethylthiazole kinase-like uncharacterized protein yjeF